ncbi:hypothetical protein BD309DRAFT_718355 [Dichomitus squalens]|uniref:Uncharacterized protein n=1 Tax=Dichomitus squalens TaxID=114155 RepID=A0A4Q9PIZ4_9APHY|nr:hypothetical protein BD309DRAFT_718355 [Dichomitus squalens]TBU54036.1 hypothetical protein BD310DRAFT_106308 [Dichomitus squalens]
MMYGLAVFSVAVFAGHTAATALAGAFPLAAIIRRQTGFDPSQIPAQCQSDCSTAVTAINTCTDVSCLCSTSTNQGLYTCLECALSLSPDASTLSQSQESLDNYEETCDQAGVNVTPLSLTLPSGGASATATATAAPISSTAVTGGSTPSTVKVSVTFNGGSTAATATATSPANTADTASSASSTGGASKNGNPLGGNGAGAIGVSTASLAVVVGIAMAALL